MGEPTIQDRLSAPFDVGELKFFPVSTTKDKTKGKVGSYIDARAVMDRLDDVVGIGGWSTSYQVLDPQTKAVECKLSVCYDGQWITKADVGYPNEGRDADNADKEPYKAAYSDALKRAGVQHRIGRYIYSLELERDWLPIDQYGKFTEEPRLKGSTAPRPPAREAPATSPISQAAFNQQELMALMAVNNVTADDLVAITGAGTSGKPRPMVWLEKNPGKTIAHLVAEAVEKKAVPV